MMEWDEVLICLTIVISSLLLVVVVVVAEERVGVAKAKQRLMTQLSHTHNLLWKLSMAQLNWNRYRYWNLPSPSPSQEQHPKNSNELLPIETKVKSGDVAKWQLEKQLNLAAPSSPI